MSIKYFRLLNRQKKKNKWTWTEYKTPSNPMYIHTIYFHLPRPQGRYGDNVCAIILTTEDIGENKSCEPWDERFIAEGELSGSDTRGITVIKPTWWTLNPPLIYEKPAIHIATVTSAQKKPRDGAAIIFYTEEES